MARLSRFARADLPAEEARERERERERDEEGGTNEREDERGNNLATTLFVCSTVLWRARS